MRYEQGHRISKGPGSEKISKNRGWQLVLLFLLSAFWFSFFLFLILHNERDQAMSGIDPVMRFSNTFWKTHEAMKKSRITVSRGGSSSSKTISALQRLTLAGAKYPGTVITLIGESRPVIKKTIFADWKRLVMKDNFHSSRYNMQDMVYTFPNGSLFQFSPGDDGSRFHGPRQDYVLIDEAYNIKKNVFDQVDIRTSKNIIITFNPTAAFWAKDLLTRPDVTEIHSTYHDNIRFLDQTIIDALEMRAKIDQNFYNVYTLGEWGSLQGIIFNQGKHWSITEEWPKEFKRRFFVLDWGFSKHPTAIVELGWVDGQVWAKEHVYETRLVNVKGVQKSVELRLEEIGVVKGRDVIVADSAEAKSIAELANKGWSIIPAEKGPGSIQAGIGLIKSHPVKVFAESINTVKEFRNYSYGRDRFGESTNEPADSFNHSIDAIRYGYAYLFHQKKHFVI